MSLMLQEASHRIHNTNTIFGAVNSALAVHSRSRKEFYGSCDSLPVSSLGATGAATRRMFSATADLITRVGVDHVVIGIISILLQIIGKGPYSHSRTLRINTKIGKPHKIHFAGK